MEKEINFPKGFLLGAATAAYQIEGAFDEDGKGENIWDTYVPENCQQNLYNEGHVAIDHYHRVEEDLDLLKELGCKVYRFSLSWSRILPDGTGKVNPKGIAFYNKIIDGLLKRGIVPAVTIYHWDLPSVFQKQGGWVNSKIIDWFCEYAKVCFDNFSDRVKYWFTLNEPYSFLMQGYGYGAVPPCMKNWKTALQATHNALLAHGNAVKLFRNGGYDGKISIVLDITPKIPFSERECDKNAADIANQTGQFWFYDAIIKGKYPEKAMRLFEEKGYAPEIAHGDMEIISQKLDFFALNYYLTEPVKFSEGKGEFNYEVVETVDYKSFAEGCYNLLHKIKNDSRLPIFISENGIHSLQEEISPDGEVYDYDRINYLEFHFKAVKKAIESGVDVFGYTVWTAFDNYSFNLGTKYRYGLIYVDYNNNFRRIIKQSGKWFKKISDNIPR